jgi:tetratricopeptide (TPR) repeat protein
MTRLGGFAAVLLMVVAAAPVARADDVSQARDHFRKGSKAFDLGHYAEAIKEYEAAYDLKEDPALLFNIAQAYRLDGDNQNAVRVYKSFLHRMPEAPNRVEVQRRIAELEKVIEQQGRAKEGPPEGTLSPTDRPATPPPIASPSVPVATPTPQGSVEATAVPPPDSHPGRNKKIAGLAVAGVGVAGIAAGIAFGVLAVNAGNDLTHLNQNMGTFDSNKQSEGQTDQIVEGVCLGIGGAALVAGAVVYALGYRDGVMRRSHAAITPFIAPGRAGLSALVSF